MKPQVEKEAARMRAWADRHKTRQRSRIAEAAATLEAKAKTQNLGTEEVSKLTGATLRQLQWWDEQNLISVQRKLGDRVYTPEDTSKVQMLIELRTRGISLQKCRKLLKTDIPTVRTICEALDVLRSAGVNF